MYKKVFLGLGIVIILMALAVPQSGLAQFGRKQVKVKEFYTPGYLRFGQDPNNSVTDTYSGQVKWLAIGKRSLFPNDSYETTDQLNTILDYVVFEPNATRAGQSVRITIPASVSGEVLFFTEVSDTWVSQKFQLRFEYFGKNNGDPTIEFVELSPNYRIDQRPNFLMNSINALLTLRPEWDMTPGGCGCPVVNESYRYTGRLVGWGEEGLNEVHPLGYKDRIVPSTFSPLHEDRKGGESSKCFVARESSSKKIGFRVRKLIGTDALQIILADTTAFRQQ